MKINLKPMCFAFFLSIGLGVFAGQPGSAAFAAEEAPAELADEPIALETAEQPPLTLRECYALALKQSEVVAIDAELIKEAEAHFTQSLGAILPQASYVWSKTNADSGFAPLGRNSDEEGKFVFTQTLFSGFRELAGMAASRLEKQQYTELKKRAEQTLFTDVADAFYLVLEYQEDIKALESIWAALRDRISELKKREDIGRSRHSEVVNTEAQLYNIEAEVEQIKSYELIVKELLNFLTGTAVDQVVDQEEIPDVLMEQSFYETKADARPDVKTKEYAWQVKQKGVTIARSDLFPTITLEGDYYTKKLIDDADADWATTLKISVPIFEGTTTYGAIKAARAQERQGELEFQRTKRLATRNINDTFVRAQSAIMRFKAYEKALKSAELNYALQKEDYQSSLVSNLDVLAAIQTLGNTQRNYLHALYEKKRTYWQLQVAIGETIEEMKP